MQTASHVKHFTRFVPDDIDGKLLHVLTRSGGEAVSFPE
jgi:hypothetical protein